MQNENREPRRVVVRSDLGRAARDSLDRVPNQSKYVFKNHHTCLKKIRILMFEVFNEDARDPMKLN